MGVNSLNDNIAVLNGTVRGMGFLGISLGRRARAERLFVESNGAIGIEVGTKRANSRQFREPQRLYRHY